MREVVIVESVRTPIGRRNGGLSTLHALDLLGAVQRELFVRSGVDPAAIGQVVGGCVAEVGMQAMNVTRNAWLAAGLPVEVAATTVDSQCGSSQQALGIAFGLISAGVIDSAVACGIEIMSRIPMGATTNDKSFGKMINRQYWKHHEYTTQFEASERLAEKFGITRSDCDEFGKLSQDRAARAWSEGRYDSQVLSIEAPAPSAAEGSAVETNRIERDEGLRDTTLEGLSALQPTARPDGVHTAGTSSQIADGAGAVLLMTREMAEHHGLTPRATVLGVCLVGCDPTLMLAGPIPATQKLLADADLTIEDIVVFEINEAFASVVLAWEKELRPDRERVNPNGGAIAIGHPLGATGSILVTKAVHELERTDGEHALVTMCCGGGLGTGTLLRRA